VSNGRYDNIGDDYRYILKPVDSQLPANIKFGVAEIKNPANGEVVTSKTKMK